MINTNKYIKVWFILASTFCLFNTSQSFAQFNFPSSSPDRIILNLTENPSTSVAVSWRTDTSILTSFCELQVATDTKINPNESKSFIAQTKRVEYSVENTAIVTANQHSHILKGLKPESKYIYRVGNKDNWSDWFQFQTPSSGGKEFSFIYFGDLQDPTKQSGRVVRRAFQESPNSGFMLYAGDIVNTPESDTDWQRWFDFGSYIFATINDTRKSRLRRPDPGLPLEFSIQTSYEWTSRT